MLRFRATLRSDSRRRVYLPLPGTPEVRHLAGTVNGMGYRGAVESIDGSPALVLGPAWRRGCGLEAGDRVAVELEPEGPQRRDLARTYSRGMMQRLAIARAILHDPPVLLLDEPAAGLNTQEKVEMAGVIRTIAREHCTVVLVEHDMALVMGTSDRVLVLNFGRTLACGKPDEVSRDPAVIDAYLGTDLQTDDADAARA